jgi:hypothetical protein
MFAKTLIKLIDFAIFPAFLIIAAKIISAVFLTNYFGVDFTIDRMRIVLENSVEFIAINSYSSLIMFFTIIAGLIWVTVKAHVFHDTHISPAFSAKLFSMNMEDLIHTTDTIYAQAFIWLSYAWIATILFGIHSYYNLMYPWIFWFALSITVFATGALALDIEREINTDKKMLDDNDNSQAPKLIRFEELAEEMLR